MNERLTGLREGFDWLDEISSDVPNFLKHHGFPKTATHSQDVAFKSHELAEQLNMDTDKAENAGWLHDVSAVFPSVERAKIARELGIEVLPEEDTFPMIIHQKLSVVVARELFGVTDSETLSAIGCDMQDREEETPTYAGLVYSDDIPELPHTRTAVSWNKTARNYKYVLGHYADRRNIWYIKAEALDNAVDEMLLERLQATDIDDDAWRQALEEMEQSERSDLRRIQQSIKEIEKTKENLLTSLTTLSDTEMIERIQSRYIRAKQQTEALQVELMQVAETDTYWQSLQEARPALQKIINQWQDVPRSERRSLFEAFAKYINVTRTGRFSKRIEIYWRDGSITNHVAQRGSLGAYCRKEDIDKLRDLIECNVDQIDILRTFPQYTWRQLQQRYAYHFNDNLWLKSYAGKVQYTRHKKWSDTDEHSAQLITDRVLSGYHHRYKLSDSCVPVKNLE